MSETIENLQERFWNWKDTLGSKGLKVRVTSRLALHFVCSRCRGIIEGMVDSIKKLCNEVKTVNGFCFTWGTD